MKFTNTTVTRPVEILANDHYVAIPYDCSKLSADSDGIVKGGTIVPKNDASAIGVLLYDVNIKENPNGAIVIHGFIKKSKLPMAPAETVALPMIQFMD